MRAVSPPARSCVSAAPRHALVAGAGPIVFALAVTLAAMAMTDAACAADAPAPDASAYSPQGADTCLGCHNDAGITGIFRTKHARPNDPRGPCGHGGLQCEPCHGRGGAQAKAGGGPPAGLTVFGPKSLATVAQQNANCLGCHQSNAAHDWASSAHAASNVACASCH